MKGEGFRLRIFTAAEAARNNTETFARGPSVFVLYAVGWLAFKAGLVAQVAVESWRNGRTAAAS